MYRMPYAIDKERSIRIVAGDDILYGDLTIPENARGLILFARGNGSHYDNPQDKTVAQYLNKGGFATLLFDLLTPSEETTDSMTGEFRFDIDLLTWRLSGATEWVKRHRPTSGLPIGYLGAGASAAAAIKASAQRGDIKAVAIRGGRPDLAGAILSELNTPTRLIIAGRDSLNLEINRKALAEMNVVRDLTIVAGAGRQFEEKPALRELGRLAVEWFSRHME